MRYINGLLKTSVEELNQLHDLSVKIFKFEVNINPLYRVDLSDFDIKNNIKEYKVFDLTNDNKSIYNIYVDLTTNKIIAQAKIIYIDGYFYSDKYKIYNKLYNSIFEGVKKEIWNYKLAISSYYTYLLYKDPNRFFEVFKINKNCFNVYFGQEIFYVYPYVYYKKHKIILPKLNKQLILSKKISICPNIIKIKKYE